jgi:hypothetical protein
MNQLITNELSPVGPSHHTPVPDDVPSATITIRAIIDPETPNWSVALDGNVTTQRVSVSCTTVGYNALGGVSPA